MGALSFLYPTLKLPEPERFIKFCEGHNTGENVGIEEKFYPTQMSVPVLSVKKLCSPKCNLFRCGKHAVVFRGNTIWCRWTEEDCNVANCTYAACIKRRLLPNGICGETIKRKTVDTEPEEEKVPTLKLRGKALRKMGGKEIF